MIPTEELRSLVAAPVVDELPELHTAHTTECCADPPTHSLPCHIN